MNRSQDAPRYSVVLVDDSREVRALVRRRLELSGLFRVVGEGSDGDEAIGLVHAHQPALLLLDASMPTADGLEALPGILALSPRTRVVIFTGFEESDLAAHARELGAADLIEKSIDLDELPRRLVRALHQGSTGSAGARQLLDLVPDDSRPDKDAFAEEQLVLDQHREPFRDLVDQAAIGMATLTVTGTIVRANRALAELMSCRPYDLVGVDYGRLTVGHGERLDRALRSIAPPGEELVAFEHPLPTFPAAGTSRVARVTLAPVRDLHQELLYVFAQVQDISAQRAAEDHLRRSEEFFRLLVSAVEEYAIFALDVDGTITTWNAGAQRIKGYAEDEIVGQNFRVFYVPEAQATSRPQRNLDAALRDGGFAEEGWRVRKDGSRFWASVVISPVHDDDGRHIGFAKVTRDQTDLLEHGEERRRADVRRRRLLVDTAHELRTPTAVIRGAAGVLRTSWQQLPGHQRDELLAEIRSSADRLGRFAADLTTASRSPAETLELRLEDLSLAQALRRAGARRETADPGVRIELDVPHDVTFRADPERLAQALDNLLDNAVRHGVPTITLHGQVTGDEVRMRVTDAGPGVPAELVPRLFERFSTGADSAGTGLGLHLVREIARGHGGDAGYDPPGPGRPTTFEIRLPRTA